MALERIDPRECRDTYVLDHYGRYCFTSPFVAGKRVLDVACGYGYGSHLLWEAGAGAVVGVDLSPEAIAYAREKYAAPGIEYVQADATELSKAVSGVFDVVVSFETIEHLREPDRFIQALRAHVNDESILFFSVPNERNTSVDNPFHLHKFNREQFETLLRQAFSVEAILPVYISVATTFGNPGRDRIGPFAHGRGRIVQIETDTPKPDTFVAICGKRGQQISFDTLSIHSWNLFKKDVEYRVWLEEQRESWARAAREQEKLKAEALKRCAAWERTSDEQAASIEELEIARLWSEKQRRACQESIRALKARIRAAEEERSRLERCRGGTDEAAVHFSEGDRILGTAVERLYADQASCEAECNQLRVELHQSREHIAAIEASFGWRFIRYLRERVLPPRTSRGRAARAVLKRLSGRNHNGGSPNPD